MIKTRFWSNGCCRDQAEAYIIKICHILDKLKCQEILKSH